MVMVQIFVGFIHTHTLLQITPKNFCYFLILKNFGKTILVKIFLLKKIKEKLETV